MDYSNTKKGSAHKVPVDGLPRPAPEIGAPRGVEGLERRDAVAAAPRVRQRDGEAVDVGRCLLYTSPSPRDLSTSRMPSSA